MESVNRIVMSGYLTKEPEYKGIGNATMCKMQIASEHSFTNSRTGATAKEICFIEVEAWGAQAVVLRQRGQIGKGSYILTERKLKLTSW